MADRIRLGEEPPPSPPPRSGKLIGLLAGLVLLAGAGAWLAGSFRASPPVATTSLPAPETTTTPAPTTTATRPDRLARARAFWTALGAGDAGAARAAVPSPSPAAVDLIGFVAAFSPGFTVDDCHEFGDDAVQCLVMVTDQQLLAIGGRGGQGRLTVSDDGLFDLPAAVASAAARLSLHALNLHTEEVQAACPLTDAPAVQGLAIVGSPTTGCGAYLAGLIPEYTAAGAGTTAAGTTVDPTRTTTPYPLYDREALDYFRQIAGGAEFGGESGTVHRWGGDLRIAIYGDPTDRDRQALAAVLGDLGDLIDTVQIETVETDPNVEIHFVPVDDFPALEPNYVEGNLGYVYAWWNAGGEIYRARVLISTTGVTAAEREHLLREELTQSLGLLNDSWLYPDSIFYQGWTDTGRYANLDRLVIEMLYRPELSAGMSIDQAITVLAGLTPG